MTQARAVALPLDSRIAPLFRGADLADAFAIPLPAHASGDIVELARAVMSSRPGFVALLMRLRDAIMGRMGVKTSRQIGEAATRRPLGAIGSFGVEDITPTEVVMGEDDRHLNFKTAMLVRPTAEGRELVWSSAVRCNNTLGRIYLTTIRPFHRLIVPAFLTEAARRGWPSGANSVQH